MDPGSARLLLGEPASPMPGLDTGDAALVSVIIPACNAEKVIGRTISSVSQQSYRNVEIIVVDDGSRDGTAEIVENISREDKRVRLIRQKNAGAAAARNRALADARGDFVAPIDADDLWHRDKLSLQVAALRSAPAKIGVVYCWSLAIDSQDMVLSNNPVPFACRAEGNVLEALAIQNFLGNGSVPLIRRSALRAVGGYDPECKHAQDWKFYLSLAERFEFALVPRALVGYRQAPDTLSTDVVGMEKDWSSVTKWVRKRHPTLARSAIAEQTYCGYVYLFQLALRRRAFFHAVRYLILSAAKNPPRFLVVLFRVAGARFYKRQLRNNVSFDAASLSDALG